MTTNLEHLSKVAKKVMLLSDEERIYHIRQDRWIGYDRANQIITKLEDLLVHPKVESMPNMLIIGDSVNGKSRLINYFFSKHRPYDNPLAKGIVVPVLRLDSPSNGSIEHLYGSILDLLLCPYNPNTKTVDLEEQAIKVLNTINLGMMIIDDIHHYFSGTPRQQRQFLAGLKSLGNLVQVPIIGVGTNAALTAFQMDPQTANHYATERLSKWNLDEQFLKLLASLMQIIPLKDPSNILDRQMATKIYAMTDGLIGEVSTLLNEAAIWVIRNKKAGQPECITMEAINACGYKRASIKARSVQ